MAKKYYRWKDENCNGINPEWVEMTGTEFLAFKRKPENKHRRFIEYIDEFLETDTIVLEATRQKYNEWHSVDSNRKRNIIAYIEMGYTTVSMDEEIDEQEEITLHEAVADKSVDVEESAILSYRIDKMHEAIAMLSEDEADLIYALYLNKPNMTERSYARQKGVSGVAIHKKKVIILEKMREFLKNI